MSHIIDIHTHCTPRQRDDPFGVAAIMGGTPVGKNIVMNYRGLPAIGHWEMDEFEFQQAECVRTGITGRMMSSRSRRRSSPPRRRSPPST